MTELSPIAPLIYSYFTLTGSSTSLRQFTLVKFIWKTISRNTPCPKNYQNNHFKPSVVNLGLTFLTSQVIGAHNKMMRDDNDGQMILDLVGLKLPDIHLTGEEKPRKNLTQETCPASKIQVHLILEINIKMSSVWFKIPTSFKNGNIFDAAGNLSLSGNIGFNWQQQCTDATNMSCGDSQAC